MKADATILVGSNHRGYLDRIFFFDLPYQKYKFVKVWDWFQALNHAFWKATGSINFVLNNSYYDLGLRWLQRDVRLLHFFNSVSYGTTPWVVTFESALPRYQSAAFLQRMGIKALAGPHCKKIIAYNRCAYDMQLWLLRAAYPEYLEPIERKMAILPVSFPLRVESYDEKRLDPGLITFSMVGGEFFRKGGLEVLRAFDRLAAKKLPVRLNLVAELTPQVYPYAVTAMHMGEARRLLQKLIDGEVVRYEKRLPNQAVIEMLINSHVGLVPTLADAQPIFVTEAQSCGCPVISTDVRALPEINDDANGWMIRVPKDQAGDALLSTAEEHATISRMVEDQLVEIVGDIVARPETVRSKGESCLERVREKHNPQTNVQFLENLYDSILARAQPQ